MLVSNKFEISYIIKQRLNEHKNRFQINTELLARGYSPEIIDEVWYSLAHPTNHKARWHEKYANRKTLVILNIIGVSLVLTLIFSNPFPVDPSPLYPAAKPINISKYKFIKFFGQTSWGDMGRYAVSLSDPATRIQVLETTDSVDDICKFYNQTALQTNLRQISVVCNPALNPNYYIYRIIYGRNWYASSQYGIGLQIFVKNEQYEKSLITDLVKNPTPDTKIILVINGYFNYNDYD